MVFTRSSLRLAEILTHHDAYTGGDGDEKTMRRWMMGPLVPLQPAHGPYVCAYNHGIYGGIRVVQDYLVEEGKGENLFQGLVVMSRGANNFENISILPFK